MDKTLVIVSAVVGSLGVLSAIFAFSAEGTKLTPYTILVYDYECIYPPNPAFGLGICAAIFLLVAQVTISAVGGCCGCCKSRSITLSETKRIVSIVCAVASWIAAVVAWVLLIKGAAWNENVVRDETGPYCDYLQDGIFAGAGVLSLAATALGITSYVMTRRHQRTTSAAAAPSAVPAKGEPQLPAPAAAQGNSGSSHEPNLQELPQTPPAAQGNSGSSHEPNLQELPPQTPPAPPGAAPPPAVASAPPEPNELTLLGTPQVPQFPIQAPQVGVGLDVPVPRPTTAAGATTPENRPTTLSTVVRNEVAKQGIRLAARVVQHSLLSDNATTNIMPDGVGDIPVSMMPDSTGDDLQDVNY